jgi:hypothetical protein
LPAGRGWRALIAALAAFAACAPGTRATTDAAVLADVAPMEAGLAAPTLSATCPAARTLEALVACLAGKLVGKNSEGYLVPDAAALADFRAVAAQMANGPCSAVALPAGLRASFTVEVFRDRGRDYCVLAETLDADGNGDVDRGWATIVVNPTATREVFFSVPHTVSDSTTEVQSAAVYEAVDARFLLVSATHRAANSQTSTCNPDYRTPDPSHNADTTFQVAFQELAGYYISRAIEFHALQFHGMAADSCACNVYISNGLARPPAAGDRVLALEANLLARNPGWQVSVYGDSPSCALNATENVQGRWLNGVPAAEVCTRAAKSASGRFVHIEQDPDFRRPADWVQAILDTWP